MKKYFKKWRRLSQTTLILKRIEVTDQLNIKDDLNADSISVMEFVLELEDEFGTERFQMKMQKKKKIETVGAAVDYIVSNSP